MKIKLKEQIKEIQKDTSPHQVNQLNSMILGMHNYYNVATGCSIDFREINFVVSKSLKHRLREKTKRQNEIKKLKSYCLEKCQNQKLMKDSMADITKNLK
ncbi:group II intron, maturase-specific domain protein [Streptococcus constellatus subsp. pharyngis SK1060 = CCUG 46377]|uniref:Group II intron, maturase-specific domain protein n=1 Tax=Streptococcus constellatus subsp. pharyngis SK1060 = CCUG 46377 TaxID=1035184 RepID=F9P875_STRCV|nr:group II intron, maturase-specific domain protein [Streptococcus constellatus subsp. pharyngis SK1060 = CCUG 46377]